MLVERPEFVPCATEKMLTYATGRGFSRHDDHAQVDAIAQAVQDGGGTFGALVEQIVLSESFRNRVPEARGEGARAPGDPGAPHRVSRDQTVTSIPREEHRREHLP